MMTGFPQHGMAAHPAAPLVSQEVMDRIENMRSDYGAEYGEHFAEWLFNVAPGDECEFICDQVAAVILEHLGSRQWYGMPYQAEVEAILDEKQVKFEEYLANMLDRRRE